MFIFRLMFLIYALMSRRAAAAQALLEEDDDIHQMRAVPLPVDLAEFDSGLGLRRHLLSGFKRGVFTAKDVCCLAFHATNGGCYGVSDLSLDPDSTWGEL